MEISTRNRVRWAVGLAITAVTSFALTGVALAGASCHEPQSEGRTTTIEIRGCFSPTIVHVDPGATVEFVNRDSYGHNVVGHGFSWGDYEQLASGQRITTVFEAAGIYPYACTIHPGMVGAVVVGEPEGGDRVGALQPQVSDASSGPWKTASIVAAVPIFAALLWRWSYRRETAAKPTTD